MAVPNNCPRKAMVAPARSMSTAMISTMGQWALGAAGATGTAGRDSLIAGVSGVGVFAAIAGFDMTVVGTGVINDWLLPVSGGGVGLRGLNPGVIGVERPTMVPVVPLFVPICALIGPPRTVSGNSSRSAINSCMFW